MSTLPSSKSVPSFNDSALKSGNQQLPLNLPEPKRKKSPIELIVMQDAMTSRCQGLAGFYRVDGGSKIYHLTYASKRRILKLICDMHQQGTMKISPARWFIGYSAEVVR